MMSNESRRDFLKHGVWSGVAGAGFLGAARGANDDNPARGPDLAVINAVVYTVDDKKPTAEAFAVHQGRFLAVGANKEIKQLITSNTKVIDARGMTVTPGFIDAHCHPASAGTSELRFVNCDKPKIAEIQAVVRIRAEKTKKGDWVFGFKYDDTKLQDGRPLSRADLDKAAPDHPVRVLHRGGHTAIYNSFAFKLAGVTSKTPDPEGGQFGRDKKGELTGFVAEKANDVFEKVGKPPLVTARERQAGVKLISELMTAAGLTSVHDASASKDAFSAYQDAHAADEMRFRMYVMVTPPLYRGLKAAGLRTGFGDEHLRIGGVKLFADGSASERTMRMSTPYVGRPKDFGILTITQEELNDLVADAHSNHFQVGTHANGDVAIDMVLQAYALAQRLKPRKDTRHRIEHCTLINEKLLKRIAAQGVIPTPFYTYVYYHGDKWLAYGKEKLKSMFAHRSFLDHKIKVAGASDYVPGPYEPLMALQSMTTRKDFKGREWGPNQKISIDEALRVCTINGAHASFEEGIKGSITPGKLADFVLLEKDPHKVDPDRIKDIKVMRTVVGGSAVHEAS